MKPVVVDASVAIKWFVPESDSGAAIKLLSSGVEFIAPDMILPEVANIIWKLHAKRLLSDGEAFQIVNDFLALPVGLYENQLLLGAAFEIALSTGQTVYDSLYVALAVSQGSILVTADKRLVNAMKNTDFGKFIKPLS